MLKEFTSSSQNEIVDRKTTFAVTPSEDISFKEVFNHLILVNDLVYYCIGVEGSPNHFKPTLLKDETVILLVVKTS